MRILLNSGMAAVAIAALLAFASADSDIADASHAGGMQAMSVDMDTTGNTATSLGLLDSCRSVTAPATFDVDVTALDVPTTAFGGMSAFAFTLNYDNASGDQTVTGNNPFFLLDASPLSSITVIVDAVPDNDGAFNSAALDNGPTPASTEVGSGVLARVTIGVGPGAAPGAYPLTLTDAAHVDAGGFAYPPDTLNNALLVVGGSCADFDGDGVPNAEDACPTRPGSASNAGCPPPGPPAVGGSFGLLDNEAAPPAATQGSGSTTRVAAAATAGLLLLGAGAILRRRLLQ